MENCGSMGQPTGHSPVMLVLVACSRYQAAIDWAQEQGVGAWGPLALSSTPMLFVETDYYEPSMGDNLKKTMLAYERLISPDRLVQIKLQTNAWEDAYAKLGRHPEPRPLNLDPGYLTLAKFVLASTKDHSHRIYLGQGIFAEVTLRYEKGRWQHRDWTYADYRRADYQQFLSRCRNWLRGRPFEGGTG